jgi:hypothetical protein
LRRAVHFLTRGIGCAPNDIMDLEVVEFHYWVKLELKAQKQDRKQKEMDMKFMLKAMGYIK